MSIFWTSRSLSATRPLGQSLCTFRERIVVRSVRTAMSLGDSQGAEQLGDRLGFHRRAAVRVDGELVGDNAFPETGLAEEFLGQRGALLLGKHPAHDVATENVQADVE